MNRHQPFEQRYYILAVLLGTLLCFIACSGKTTTPPDDMVLIPAGEFQMGSNDGYTNEQPVHTVYVDAFFMDKYEVTNAQYKEFVDANPQWQKSRIPSSLHDERFYLYHWTGNNYPTGKGNHPVTWVSWYAAMAYAKWKGKRLPTEAEWERAARGGLEGKEYPNGNAINPQQANYGNNVKDTTAVAKYPANGYGLYDMAGNVSEWCLDEYREDFDLTLPRNGVAKNPLSGANNIQWILDNVTDVGNVSRVLRGGSWSSKVLGVRVASRYSLAPTSTDSFYSFRCARSVTP